MARSGAWPTYSGGVAFARWLHYCNVTSRFMIRLSLCFALLIGCAARVSFVPGTRIPYSDANKSVLDTVEEYRLAVERGDADRLMLMAAKQYWEDSGTPTGSDDYGYD